MRKRGNYRPVFDNFDFTKISRKGTRKIQALMSNNGIVGNRLKILSAVKNAKAFLEIHEEFSSFERYIWQFVGAEPLVNERSSLRHTFVGSTICYAFMQAVGMVNDQVTTCFRYRQLGGSSETIGHRRAIVNVNDRVPQFVALLGHFR